MSGHKATKIQEDSALLEFIKLYASSGTLTGDRLTKQFNSSTQQLAEARAEISKILEGTNPGDRLTQDSVDTLHIMGLMARIHKGFLNASGDGDLTPKESLAAISTAISDSIDLSGIEPKDKFVKIIKDLMHDAGIKDPDLDVVRNLAIAVQINSTTEVEKAPGSPDRPKMNSPEQSKPSGPSGDNNSPSSHPKLGF